MEEQGKPAKKWYKKRSTLLAALILVCVAAAIIVLLMDKHDNNDNTCFHSGYCVDKEIIQRAITDYSETHNGTLPTLNGTYTNANCSNCSVINMSALLVINGGELSYNYSGNFNLNASGNDNCGGNASLGCSNYDSYIWIVNTNGTVFSYCAGGNCKTNNSGYQGVWP